MSASEYGFHIEPENPNEARALFSNHKAAEEVVELAEYILEERYGFRPTFEYENGSTEIGVQSEDPAPFLAVKEAADTLQSVETLEEAYDLLEDEL